MGRDQGRHQVLIVTAAFAALGFALYFQLG